MITAPRLLRITTPRLALHAATAELVRAQLDEPELWHRLLGARAPEGWPPEGTEDVWEYFWQWLVADPSAVGWTMWYIVKPDPEDPVLVGTCGFKGRPDGAGDVETGYSIVRSFQRQGFASEAVGGLLAWAFEHPDVRRVVAHTYPDHVASIGVLHRLGFTRVDEPQTEPGTIRFALARP